MSSSQLLLLAILGATLALFLSGRLRHDIVAVLTLLACVLGGLVPPTEAFSGLAHPATVTVALVLVTSRGLLTSGAVDRLAHALRPATGSVATHVGSLSAVGAALSGFMNNVGALALLLPIAIDTSTRARRSPGIVLMPLSFATILGGMLTAIGTPPNLIVSGYRQEALGAPFDLFDFTPVGLSVALVGVAFVALVGWRLLPVDRRTTPPTSELAVIGDYLAELRVPDESEWIDKPARELVDEAAEHDVVLIGLIRGSRRYWASATTQDLRAGDVLVVEATPTALRDLLTATKLELTGTGEDAGGSLRAGDVAIAEAVVPASSRVVGRTARSLHLRRRHGITLLGLSRQGTTHRPRLRDAVLRAGDVLLLHGEASRLEEAQLSLGVMPMQDRDLRVGTTRGAGLAVALFAAAIAATAFSLAPLAIALLVVVTVYVLTGLLPLRDVYASIDWPVVVLLAAMLPVGTALETTGTVDRIAELIATLGGSLPSAALLTVMLVVAMSLSDLMNNAATAVVLAPVAAGLAIELGHSPDAYLMAVAIGASCAFLTPIGHQNNTLVLGPGRYRFGDYWRMGLPLQILILLVAVPALLLFWSD